MATYVILATFTDQGIRAAKDLPISECLLKRPNSCSTIPALINASAKSGLSFSLAVRPAPPARNLPNP